VKGGVEVQARETLAEDDEREPARLRRRCPLSMVAALCRRDSFGHIAVAPSRAARATAKDENQKPRTLSICLLLIDQSITPPRRLER